ncbi:MAG: thiol peroxidase [Pseudomonadota bacterium]|nr:thiol peroxidase [Pseudomonadota bacterium]
MSTVTLRGQEIQVFGEMLPVGSDAPGLRLVGLDLADVTLHDFAGRKKLLNIFPSIDTPTCAMSVRKFNERAAAIDGAAVLCVSADLPFAQKRFCGAEGIANVTMLSLMRGRQFGKDYGLLIETGPMAGLTARAVIVLDADNRIVYSELVPEIGNEPNYDAALAALA